MKDENEKLAEERTNWAEDRTIMANERTFSSWSGTGLGAIGVAIGFQAVFQEFEPTWIAKSVALLLIAIAIAIFWSAQKNACKTLQRLNEREVEATPPRTYQLISGGLSLVAFGTGIVLALV